MQILDREKLLPQELSRMIRKGQVEKVLWENRAGSGGIRPATKYPGESSSYLVLPVILDLNAFPLEGAEGVIFLIP